MTLAAESKTVWVVGGRGMLGQAVCAALTEFGHIPVATGREHDLTDDQALFEFVRGQAPSHMINCAAMTAVDDCESQYNEAHRVNAQGPKTLGQVAAHFGLSAVHVSTDYVFDGQGSTPKNERDPTEPQSVYGQSKLAGERQFLQAFPEGQVVRTSWLFGPGGNNFVATMLRLMQQRERLEVVDDQHGRPTSTWDLASALIALQGLVPKAGDRAPGGIYHFANTTAVTWHGLAVATHREAQKHLPNLVCQEIGKTTTAQFVRPAPRPAYAVMNTDKVATTLGRQPRPFTEPLQRYVAEYMQANRG